MAYIAFDMDETLGSLYTVYPFMCSLRGEDFFKDIQPSPKVQLNLDLKVIMDISYMIFVSKLADLERSRMPLGILRPGILNIMRKIAILHKKGTVKGVVLYSNNGHLVLLELIRDIIHQAIGYDHLICDCIHWNHPIRAFERSNQPGSAPKTWDTLYRIFVEGKCKADPSLAPSHVLFFDDQPHPDLMSALGQNYIFIKPYTYKVHITLLVGPYLDAMYATNIWAVQDYQRYIQKYCCPELGFPSTLQQYISRLRKESRNTSPLSQVPPLPDATIEQMKTAIDRFIYQISKEKPLNVKEYLQMRKPNPVRIYKVSIKNKADK